MSNKNVRRTYNLIGFVAFPVGFFLIGCLAVLVHGIVSLLIFPWLYFINIWQISLRCPNCGTRIRRPLRHIHSLEMDFIMGPYIAPKHCEHCGFDLTGREG